MGGRMLAEAQSTGMWECPCEPGMMPEYKPVSVWRWPIPSSFFNDFKHQSWPFFFKTIRHIHTSNPAQGPTTIYFTLSLYSWFNTSGFCYLIYLCPLFHFRNRQMDENVPKGLEVGQVQQCHVCIQIEVCSPHARHWQLLGSHGFHSFFLFLSNHFALFSYDIKILAIFFVFCKRLLEYSEQWKWRTLWLLDQI